MTLGNSNLWWLVLGYDILSEVQCGKQLSTLKSKIV